MSCRVWRRLTAGALALVLSPIAAHAECSGKDILGPLSISEPAAHEALFERAHQVPNAQGLFWRIDKPGVPPSYLFGTYHDTKAVETVPDAVWKAIASARGAWFEISLAEQERLQSDMLTDPMNVIYDLSQTPLSQRIPAAAKPLLEAALAERGIPLEAAEQMRGWMLFAILGFPACQLRSIQGGEAVMDDQLARYGIESGVANHGLETYEESLGALEAMAPDDLTGMMIDLGTSLPDEEDIHKTMQGLYAAGETMAIYEFGIWYSEKQGISGARARSDAFLDSALVMRNRNWMPEIGVALAEGNAFVGVGALHLPGEAGIVELIRGEGYTVTRLD
ncbi:MAG: TraB/GumN family protein [Pseudomonadota bacterium]